MATLAEIRAKLLAQENKSSGNSNSSGPNAIYRHWDIPTDSTAVVRFLPDANPKNDFFWVERQMINLEFPGVKGGVENKPVTVKVPCVEMYNDGSVCPVHAEIRPWYKDPSMEALASKYWKKRSYLFQGFVVDDPLKEDEKPENPIRKFTISAQIFKPLKAALMDPDMEHMPTDYDSGTDFRITKTQDGKYANYGTSSYSRKERSLTEEERQAIEQYGLNDLSELLPKKPTDSELAVIMEMFEASVDGELYDPDRWGNFYRPWGLDMDKYPNAVPNNGSSAPAPKATPKPAPKAAPKVESAPVVEDHDDEPPFEIEAVAETATASAKPKQDAADILAMIRSRKSD